MGHHWVEGLCSNPRALRTLCAELGPILIKMCERTGSHGFVVKGHSGMVIAAHISAVANLPFIMIRSVGEQPVSANGEKPSGYRDAPPNSKWVFLDDLIEQGRTIDHVVEEMGKFGLQVAGIVTYNDNPGRCGTVSYIGLPWEGIEAV